MSEQIDDGGPAFPFGREWNIDRSEVSTWEEPGMTLRDWFAGQAVPAMSAYHANEMKDAIAKGYGDDETPSPAEKEALVRMVADCVAQASYLIADAMLAARNEPKC